MAAEYTVLADLKTYLGISVSTYDTLLAALIERAERLVADYCGRDSMLEAARTEKLPGEGGDRVVLKHTPLTDATVTVVLRWPGASDVTLDSTAYEVDRTNGIIKLVSYGSWYAAFAGGVGAWHPGPVLPPLIEPSFGNGQVNVVVTYTGGYTTVPGPIQQAVYDIVQTLYYNRLRDTSVQSEKLGDYEYKLGGSGSGGESLSKSIESILSLYCGDYRRGVFI